MHNAASYRNKNYHRTPRSAALRAGGPAARREGREVFLSFFLSLRASRVATGVQSICGSKILVMRARFVG